MVDLGKKNEKKMSADDFKKYEEVVPVANNILVEVLDKEQSRKLDSGLYIEEQVVTNSKPYLVVRKVSANLQSMGLNIEPDDLVEIGNGHVSFFYGHNLERYALLNSSQIAGVYKKKRE